MTVSARMQTPLRKARPSPPRRIPFGGHWQLWWRLDGYSVHWQLWWRLDGYSMNLSVVVVVVAVRGEEGNRKRVTHGNTPYQLIHVSVWQLTAGLLIINPTKNECT
ncbi:hypothetical protein SOVF_125910 [Spinacia oleracea]|nr:hypothetical protein SOVF_125910 [Spinacia oleracea]